MLLAYKKKKKKRKLFRYGCFFCLASTKPMEPALMPAPYRAVLRKFHYFLFLFGPGQQLSYRFVFCYVQIGKKACNYLILYMTCSIWPFTGGFSVLIFFPHYVSVVVSCISLSRTLWLSHFLVGTSARYRVCQPPRCPGRLPTYLLSIRSPGGPQGGCCSSSLYILIQVQVSCPFPGHNQH